MEQKAQISFQKLIHIIKGLNPSQRTKIKSLLVKNQKKNGDKARFVELLLHGPVYSRAEVAIVRNNRKMITSWRRKD